MRVVAELLGFAVLGVLLFAGARVVWQRTDVQNFFGFLKTGEHIEDGSAGTVGTTEVPGATTTTRTRSPRRSSEV